jgi:hypothetical protein
MRAIIVFAILFVIVAATHHGAYRPYPTAPMPAVNVP